MAVEQTSSPPFKSTQSHAQPEPNLVPAAEEKLDLNSSKEPKSLSIAAASIVAKLTRDRIMSRLDKEFPGYNWSQNAGYPTKMHKSAILDIGITPYHRRSFKPVYNILYKQNI